MATSGVNIKMAVSGVAQFKQNINQAKNSLKTLDEQLKLNEKEFKSTGDAQTYMENKAKLLNVKLAEQKAIVDNAQKALDDMSKRGVDKASKAYQDMQRQMLQAKGGLLDTQSAMDGVAEAGDEAANGVSEMNAQLAKVGQGVGWQNVTDGLEKITGGMQAAIKKAWELGKSIVNATLGAGAWADELGETADKYEISPERLYRMRQVADQIDTDAETILDAQDKLAKNRNKGGKEFMGALAALGIKNPDKLNNTELFWTAGEKLKNFADAESKVTYANALFGKSWRELLPLFTAGKEEYDKVFGETSWIGDENFDSLAKLDDTSQKLNNTWETLQNTFLGTLAGPMTEVMEILTGVLQEFNEYLQSDEGKAALKQMGDTITALIRDLVNINPEEVAGGIKTVIDKITEAFKWIDEHQGDVETALKVIAGGFAALELGKVALNIGKIVNGFKALGLGGAGAGAGGAGAGAGAGTGAGAGATGGFWAMNGLSALAPLAVFVAGVAPAVIAQAQNERTWAEEKQKRQETAGKLTGSDQAFMEGSAAVMDQIHQWTDDPLKLLMGLQSRGGVERAKLFNMLVGQSSQGNWATNELLDLWKTGGEGWDQARLLSLLDVVSAGYERMAEQTSDVTGATEDQTKASKDMTDAAKELQKIPGEIAKSINGMNVVMDGQAVGNVMLPYINSGLATQIP